MTVADEHIAYHYHKHEQGAYEELLMDVLGVRVHVQPSTGEYDRNYWLCTITLDPWLHVNGHEVQGDAAGVIHDMELAMTDCQPNANVEALRVALDVAGIDALIMIIIGRCHDHKCRDKDRHSMPMIQ